MPIYDYRCNECKATYDIYHKTRENADDILCPACGSKEHTRLVSVPGIAAVREQSGGNYPPPPCETGGGCCGGGSCGMN